MHPTTSACYVVQHVDCGHIASIGPTRGHAVRVHTTLAEMGHHGWRVRTLPPGADPSEVMAGILSTEARGCARCDLDSDRVAAILAATIMTTGATR